MRKCNVGGQAVIEGVMMRGSKGVATAVRTPSGKIEIDVKEYTPYAKRNKLFGLPVIRGFISLVESLVVGIQTLNYSASFFEEETEPSKFENWFKGVFKEKTNDIIIGFSLMLSLVFAVLLFFILPTLSANLFKRLGLSNLGLNIAEGAIRVSIFLLYMYLIGKMEDIKRVFEYHGAEHKTIFCYENESELTPENANRFTRLHPRCGTNFLFLVMLVSIILFSFTGWRSVWERMLYRIILLPLVSGITYELIRWLGKSESLVAKIIAHPGLKLQGLTTKEPTLDQLEVAIAALKAAEGIKSDEDTVSTEEGCQACCSEVSFKSEEGTLINTLEVEAENGVSSEAVKIGKLLTKGYSILKEAEIETYIIDAQLLLAKVLTRDKIDVITNREEFVKKEAAEKYFRLIEFRRNKMPVKYILEECEFMGINLYVTKGVLIPRPDTETLVEAVISDIKERQYKTICDVCSGSGAIGLAIALNTETIVESYDISEDAERVTRENVERLKLEDRVVFSKSDLLQLALGKGRKFDVIVSNPPYIKTEVIPTLMSDVRDYEPYIALWGGDDGLSFYRRIVAESLNCLMQGGLLAFEIGHDQSKEVMGLLQANGFIEVTCIKDLSGNDRVVKGYMQ